MSAPELQPDREATGSRDSVAGFLSPRTLRLSLITVILAVLGYLALSVWAGWDAIAAALTRIGPGVALGLLALSLVNYSLRFVRWQHYLHLLGGAPAWRPSLRIYFAGFALTTSPGKLGELLRGALLKPYGIGLLASTAAFFSERCADLMGILILSSLGFWHYPAGASLLLAIVAGVGVLLLAVQYPGWIALVERWSEGRRGRLFVLLGHLCQLVLSFRRCFAWPTLALALVLGVAAWGAEALAFHWLLVRLDCQVSLPMAVFIYSFAMLIGGLSFLPGGLGGSEAVMIGLLVWQGVAHPLAVTVTLITRLATLWFAVVLGIVALGRQQREIRLSGASS